MEIDKLSEYLKNIFEKMGFNIILLIGFAGIILLSYDELFIKETPVENSDFSSETYIQKTEKTLTELLSNVYGAGQVKVMVTLESGQENVYAWQEKTTQDVKSVSTDNGQQSDRYTYENEIVMVSDGNSKQALVEKTLQPVVQGVVVICSGADDIKVVSDITNAVSVALNVSSNRVCVIKMK